MDNINEETVEKDLKLFGNLGYNNIIVINQLIDDMDENLAYLIITRACNYAYENHIFTLLESEILSKALRLIQKNNESNN
jgi:hypothetical protein